MLFWFLRFSTFALRPTRLDSFCIHIATDTISISFGYVNSAGATVWISTSSSGSGTPNSIAKFTSATAIGDSQSTDNGTDAATLAAGTLTLTAGTTATLSGNFVSIAGATGTTVSSTAGTTTLRALGGLVSITATTSIGLAAGTTLGLTGSTGATLQATTGTLGLTAAGGPISATATTTVGITAGTNLTLTSTAGTVLIQALGGPLQLTASTSATITGATNVTIIATTGPALVSAPDAAGTALLNAGAAPITPAAGVAKVQGLNGSLINGLLFLGSTDIAGLGAGIFVGASAAFAYATNLHKLTAAGPYPAIEGGAGTGGLVERSAAGVWYIPGTLIVAS